MKFTAEDGSEYELHHKDQRFKDDGSLEETLVIRRIPEKSELNKWIESCAEYREKQGMPDPGCNRGMEGGFLKAIEVLESENAGPYGKETIAANILKTFAGVK